MEPTALMVVPAGHQSGQKRKAMESDWKYYHNLGSARSISGLRNKKSKVCINVTDYSDPFAVRMLQGFNTNRYGSLTNEMEALEKMRMDLVKACLLKYPAVAYIELDCLKGTVEEGTKLSTFEECTKLGIQQNSCDVICLDDDDDDGDVAVNKVATDNDSLNNITSSKSPIVIPDSDDEDNGEWKPQNIIQEVVTPYHLQRFVPQYPLPGSVSFTEGLQQYPFQEICRGPSEQLLIEGSRDVQTKKEEKVSREINTEKDKGVYVGVEDSDDSESEIADDGLGDIWNQMAMAMECSKDVTKDSSTKEQKQVDDEVCDHQFILKDDIGDVCRLCGVVKRNIESIIEVQFTKVKRSTRTYASERNSKDNEAAEIAIKFSEGCFTSGISAHPSHMKQMKPHQIEGFNFLSSNLVTENPGGCILAHAPGSGKTFMIISFMQSFLAKYPQARPLVVLPKGILGTWKKEFHRWQVEHFALFDFYSVKAENRLQQLEVLKKWVGEKSILFLGYKQFSTIVCDRTSKISVSCQDILLKVPSILILDEGHTPRNEDTDVLQSLARVQTPRKVVLSGTLYQNSVKEVFNILNLVRPKFIKLDTSKSVIRRILSRAPLSDFKKNLKGGLEQAFFDIVEHTLQKAEDNKMKVSIIKDLREMTSKVLHYYKGDFLDELPGLVDFTVLLNLSSKQEYEVEKLQKFERKFKIASVGSAVYLHPKLNTFSDISDARMAASIDAKMDGLLEELDLKDGVKAKFFLNMIKLCESSGEKLLVFSQYLIPLKFLERLAMKEKGWTAGRELFTITGDSNAEQREWSMERFNNSSESRVFFGSIRACGEGISLVGASRIIILDVPLNPSVSRQAIGRAFRPGQNKKVYTYRLVAADSPEEADHRTCFKKELISKMWFEWNEYLRNQTFEAEKVDMDECGDPYFDSPFLKEDVRFLYKR